MSAQPMLLDSAEQKSSRWNNPLIDALPYATRVALLCFGCGFSALSLSWALFLIEYEHPNSTQPPTRT